MEIAGLPLHALVVHGAVVLTPIAVLASWTYVLLSGWRWLSRWLLLLTSTVSLLTVATAWVSGRSLLAARPFLDADTSPVRDLVATHQQRATVLLVVLALFTVVAGVAFWLLPAPSGLTSGALHHEGRVTGTTAAWIGYALAVLGLAVLVAVVLTGDAGARAVWRI